MLTVAAALMHFAIPAGPIHDSMFRWMELSDYQIMYPFDDFNGLEAQRVDCLCEPLEALKIMVGLIARWEVGNSGDSVTMVLKICRPELGAHAPLPPCEPQGMSTMRP